MAEGRATSRVSRRALLAGAGAGLAGAGLTGAALAGPAGIGGPAGAGGLAGAARPAHSGFYGAHQAGIIDPPPAQLAIAAFDLIARSRDGLAQTLRGWSGLAAELTSTQAGVQGCLTITLGIGPSLFDDDRLGLADRRPAALVALPPFDREALDPHASGGDLCVQVCSADPATAHLALRALVNAARTQVALRWRQTGFRAVDGTPDSPSMFGFRDGTANLDVRDDAATSAHLWVSDGPQWMHGGTYLVARRIRLLLDTWDRTDLAQQEAIIGRRRDGNTRFDAGPTAHARLASPESNGGATLLRRAFSYDAGVDPNGLMDSGLIFICFQRDPGRQFVAIQRRLAAADALNAFSQHQASGLFACPPGCQDGSWIGEELFS